MFINLPIEALLSEVQPAGLLLNLKKDLRFRMHFEAFMCIITFLPTPWIDHPCEKLIKENVLLVFDTQRLHFIIYDKGWLFKKVVLE